MCFERNQLHAARVASSCAQGLVPWGFPSRHQHDAPCLTISRILAVSVSNLYLLAHLPLHRLSVIFQRRCSDVYRRVYYWDIRRQP